MGSSGVDVATKEIHTIHHCGFEGIVEWWIDPQTDRTTMYAECPGCGGELQEGLE